jgi:TPR repeat protein
MRRSWIIIACFLLGPVLLSTLREEQAKSAEQSSASVPVQDCDRLAQPPNMGSRYPPVSGVAPDKIDGKAAQEACERAIQKFPGEARFKAYLARVLFVSLNRPDDAVAVLRQAADQGDAHAQGSLGLMYEDGNHVQQSYTEALKWYRLAADQGNTTAQNNLGLLYAMGRGAPRSDTEALKWYRLAAEQGYVEAQYNLGLMYEHGRGVPQSNSEALKWYRLAAAQGDKDAQKKLQSLDKTSP